MIGCILSPTSGDVIISDVSTKALSPDALARLRRQHIGFIFQSYNLFPTLNAIENVRLALDVRGMKGSETRERAIEALKAVGLGHRMKNYPRQMSGGEQQRVAVARALAGSPSIILADEPTAALDSENGHGVMKLLREIAHKEERSVLAVTHDHRTLSYADRILRIEDGRITGDERGDADGGSDANDHSTERRKKTDA